jgi:hypothetical protein
LCIAIYTTRGDGDDALALSLIFGGKSLASLAPYPESEIEQAAPVQQFDAPPAARAKPRSVERDRARTLLAVTDVFWIAFSIGIASLYRNKDALSDQVINLLPVILPL